MEDLTANGCLLWNKYVTVDLDHAKLLVSTLGKFNAVSFAIKAQKPKLFKRFKELRDFLADSFLDGHWGDYVIESIQKAADTIPESDPENRNKMLTLTENLKETTVKLVGHEPRRLLV